MNPVHVAADFCSFCGAEFLVQEEEKISTKSLCSRCKQNGVNEKVVHYLDEQAEMDLDVDLGILDDQDFVCSTKEKDENGKGNKG